MKALREYLTGVRARPIHPAAVLGVALILTAAGVNALVVEPGEARLEALQEALAQRARPASAAAVPVGDANTPSAKLQSFYAFFRRDAAISDWLARTYDVADRAGVRPQRADYRLAEAGGTPLLRYEVTLPLVGDYGRIRAFAEGVLNTVPIASLDHIAFRRQKAGQREIEAELRFTLYLADVQ